MTPYYGDAAVSDVIMQVNKLWCRPCSKIGYKKCPLGHFKCMEKINVDDVLSKVKTRL
jgi:heptosyltransferase-2